MYTCIKQVVKSVHLALPTSFISTEMAGVSEILESWKRQYIQQLQGVVVNYSKVSLLPRSGFISIGKPCVHVDITAEFDLFCPSVGDIVKGKINRISREHIGCLVHGTINVTIHFTDDTPPEVSRFVYLDGEVLFQITHFDFQRKVIRVNGKISEECVRLMDDMFPESEEKFTITPSRCLINPAKTPEVSDGSDADDINHRLPKVEPFSDFEGTTNDNESYIHDLLQIFKTDKETDGEVSSPNKLAFKKSPISTKKKRRKDSLSSSNLDISEFLTNDDTENERKEKSLKKRKRESEKRKREDSLSSSTHETSELSTFDAKEERKKEKSSKKRKQKNSLSSSTFETSELSTSDAKEKNNEKKSLKKRKRQDSLSSTFDTSDLSTFDVKERKKKEKSSNKRKREDSLSSNLDASELIPLKEKKNKPEDGFASSALDMLELLVSEEKAKKKKSSSQSNKKQKNDDSSSYVENKHDDPTLTNFTLFNSDKILEIMKEEKGSSAESDDGKSPKKESSPSLLDNVNKELPNKKSATSSEKQSKVKDKKKSNSSKKKGKHLSSGSVLKKDKKKSSKEKHHAKDHKHKSTKSKLKKSKKSKTSKEKKKKKVVSTE